ncbi:MAG: HAMP domain-containing sensor histidine kinase [Planctomycetaceae bacterium]|nr:HAMP domain-containing sensor histidine kinase [Planctomycetaceae bacterium]
MAEYNILRGCLHDLADDNGLSLQGQPFHIVNRVLDGAIGLAVQSYATQQAREVQHRREEYLAFVAHDLRTPLNAISLAARVLELTLPEASARAETAQMFTALRRNVLHLERLVSKVIEESTNLQTEIGIKLERRTFDLWPLVEALIHDLHPVAGTNSTRLRNKVPEDLVVYADASLLRRVFQNLIANAIKYTPRGEVVIGARELSEEEALECWVGDNGAGIPEALLEKVFDKGETDPEQAGGMGLGLAIVKTFTEAHGGKVSVESTEGVGSMFRFSLPKKANLND